MMMLCYGTLFLVINMFGYSSASIPGDKPPGIVVRLTPSALNFASNFVVEHVLLGNILHDMDDAISETEKTCGGKFDTCSLRIIDHGKRRNFRKTSNVTIRRGGIIDWKLVIDELYVSNDFVFSTRNGNESAYVTGVAGYSLKGSSFAVEFAFTRGTDRKLNISVTRWSADIPLINRTVFVTSKVGNSSKLESDFLSKDMDDYWQDVVNRSARAVMCNVAKQVARWIPHGLEQRIWKLNSSAGIYFDDTLVRDPITEPEYIELAFKGEFGIVGEDLGDSIEPHDLNLPPRNSSMVGIYISDYVINTLSAAIFKKEFLAVTIRKDNWVTTMYQYYRNLFDTRCEDLFCFKTIFPNIVKKYPKVSSVGFSMRVTSPPTVKFSRNSVSSEAEVDLAVVAPGSMFTPDLTLAILSMRVQKSASVYFLTFNDWVAAVVTAHNVIVTDNESPERFASYQPHLNFLLQTMTDSIAVPWINLQGAIGYSLDLLLLGVDPRLFSEFLEFRLFNTETGFHEGFFGFSTDAVYHKRRPIQWNDEH